MNEINLSVAYVKETQKNKKKNKKKLQLNHTIVRKLLFWKIVS